MPRATLDQAVRQLCRLAEGQADATDRDLLERFAARRDEEAFAALVRRHGSMVLGVCRRVLGEHDAEDAFQATFLVLAKKSGARGWQTSVASWLYETARRLAARARADAARRRAREVETPAHVPTTPGAACREVCAVLDEELARLPEVCRAPLVLCYLEGRTRDQAARELGCSRRSLHRRLARALELLRQRLARRGLTFSAALAAVLAQPVLARPLAEAAVRAATVPGAATPAAAALAGAGLGGVRSVVLALTASALVLAAGATAGGLFLRAPSPAQPRKQVATRAVDAHGDPLPEGALARLGTTRLRQVGQLTCMAVTPDGKCVITGGPDERHLVVWDLATGRRLRSVGDHEGVCRAAVSPDGRLLATSARAGEVRLWDLASGRLLHVLSTPPDAEIVAVLFTPDGKSLVAGAGRALFWDPVTGQGQRHRLPGFLPKPLQSLALSPDGRYLAAGGEGTVTVWETATGREHARFRGHAGRVTALAFAPDGETLFSGDWDGLVLAWDLKEKKEIGVIGKHHDTSHSYQNSLLALAVSPDGRTLASAGLARTIRLWDVPAKKERHRLGPQPTAVNALSFSADGRTLLAAGKVVRRWDVETGREVLSPGGHDSAVMSLAVSPDGRTVVTAGSDSTLRFWDPEGRERFRVEGPRHGAPGGFSAVRFSPDGRVVAAAANGVPGVRLWDAATGRPLRLFHGRPDEAPRCLAFSPDGSLLAVGTERGHVRLYETATGESLRVLGDPTSRVCSLAFSPDGKRLAVGGHDHYVRLWETATGKEVSRLGNGRPDDVWDVSTLVGLAFSPDGALLAGASGGGYGIVWEVAGGVEKVALRSDRIACLAVAFSPDGRTLALAGADGTVRLWERSSWQERFVLAGHTSTVNALAYSPDGRRLVTGSDDTTALVWDIGALGRPERALGAGDLPQLWADLAGNAGRAFRAGAAMRQLPAHTVAWLEKHLQPVPRPDPARLARLVRDLDDERFAVREQASAGLEVLGEGAVPALRRGLVDRPSPELRRRAQELLDRLDRLTPERLRQGRAVELLEAMDTPDARRLLEQLAGGEPSARLTTEAKATLERLGCAKGS